MPTPKPLLTFRNIKSGLQGEARAAMQQISDLCVEVMASDISTEQKQKFVEALGALPAATTEMEKPRGGAYAYHRHNATLWR